MQNYEGLGLCEDFLIYTRPTSAFLVISINESIDHA